VRQRAQNRLSVRLSPTIGSSSKQVNSGPAVEPFGYIADLLVTGVVSLVPAFSSLDDATRFLISAVTWSTTGVAFSNAADSRYKWTGKSKPRQFQSASGP